MTTDTTDSPRRQGQPLLWLLLASLLLHVVLFITLGPMLLTRMELDREQEQSREENVKQREQERQLTEQQRRERMQLSEQQARKLRADQERRSASVLRERLTQLEQISVEMERVRNRKLKDLQNRTEAEIVMSRFNKLRQMADGITHKAENVKGYSSKRPELRDYLDEQAAKRDTQLAHLAAEIQSANQPESASVQLSDEPKTEEPRASAQRLIHPDAYKANAADLAELARQQFDELTEQQEIEPDGGQRHRMKKVKEALAEFAEEAKELASGIDMQQANSTEEIVASAMSRPEIKSDASTAELYRTAISLEKKVQSEFNTSRAVEIAQTQGTSLETALKNTTVQPPGRPDLDEALSKPNPTTVGEFDRFRNALSRADRETTDIRTRALSLLSQAGGDTGDIAGSGQTPPVAPVQRAPSGQRGMVISQAARGQRHRVVNMTGLLSGASGGFVDDEGLRVADFDSGIRDPTEAMRLLIGPELRINPDQAQQNALPGRSFRDSSERQGWLYVDTWYVIGPWENDGQLRHEISHPPEQVIDFDAVYTNGKFATDPAHPAHRMRWRFYQSDQIRCQPPVVYNDSTYYAYTEISSDRNREVLLTISTDDAAKAWLNGQAVWEDIGLSPWSLGEGFRRVPLRKGFNTLLVRIENGPLHCVWSVLLCPTEILETPSIEP